MVRWAEAEHNNNYTRMLTTTLYYTIHFGNLIKSTIIFHDKNCLQIHGVINVIGHINDVIHKYF